jgi:hypothetical protein
MTEMYVAHALIGPRKYIQGRGLISSLADDRREGGDRAKRTIHNMPWSVDAEMVCDAMIAADAYGRAFREAARV